MSRNVVILCLDSVRKDYFDRYAPHLRDLAEVSFEQCRAASSWSVPSHASMFTGKLPSEHGIHAHDRWFTDLDPQETFLARLPNHETVGVSANAYASAEFDFDRLFDTFSTISWRSRFPEGLNISEFDREYDGDAKYRAFVRAALRHQHPLKSLSNAVLFKVNQLNRRLPIPNLLDDGASIVSKEVRQQVHETKEPFFMFVNVMDAHGPFSHVRGYDRELHNASNTWDSAREIATWEINLEGPGEKHEDDIEKLRGLYAAAIKYLDRTVADLITDLQRDTDKETTIIVTADHGENLVYPDDNYLFEHTGSLSEGLLHVPFYLVNPPGWYATSESEYFSHLRIGKLIAGVTENEPVRPFEDRIGAEVIGGNHFPDGERSEYWDRAIRCAYRDNQKFVWDSLGNSGKYILSKTDPCRQEELDTDVDVPGWAISLFDGSITEAKHKAMRNQRSDDIDEVTERRLKELGYM